MKELVLDISVWDDGIDLAEWKRRRNLWGVIVKCGGNEKGRYRDRCFETHYAKAKAAGLHVGTYFYSTVTSAEEAVKDAEYCLSLIEGKKLDLPTYIDVEDIGQTSIGKRRLTDVVLGFIRTVNAGGRYGGVYTSGSWWQNCVYADELRPYANWIAWWVPERPAAIADVGMWQQGGMRLSDGDVRFGDGDDYHDCDWCYVDYPSIIAGGAGRDESKEPTTGGLLTYAMAAAEVCDHFIDHDAHGYSQLARDGSADVETIRLSDGTEVSFQGGDRDCSRLMQTCYVVVGALPRGMHMWTGNERETLLDNGFVEVSLDGLKRGDVLWVAGHTEMYLGNGMQGGARRSETHGIHGAVGDQDGLEITRSAFVRSQWTSAYRCAKVRPGSDATPEPTPTPAPTVGGTYRCAVPALNVRDQPSTKGRVVTQYHRGQTVKLDAWSEVADGCVWGRYKGASSGKLRYVAVSKGSADYLVRVV